MLSIADIVTATDARVVQGTPRGEITGVSTDTRTLQAGELFIALIGERLDGHQYVPDAAARGAAAVLVSRPVDAPPEVCVLLVEDTLAALGKLAAAWRRRFQIPVVAVTGSVGKTTVKEMIAAVLGGRGELERSSPDRASVLKTPVNFNNEIGVPLTVLRLGPQHQAAVFELGMPGRGQIRHLAEIVAPTVGVVTNIGISHLELWQTPLAIAEAKAELLDVMGAGGTAVLPQESEHLPLLRRKAPRALTFGLDAGDVRARDLRVGGETVSFDLWLPNDAEAVLNGTAKPDACPPARWRAGRWLPVRLPAPGRHNAVNALAAAAAGLCVGLPAKQIVAGLQAFETVAGRMRVLPAPGGFTIIDDSYNASPDSMRAALGVLADIEGKARIAVLGEMRELGPDSAAIHRTVGLQAGRLPLSLLITVGELGNEIAVGAADAQSPAAIMSVPDAPAALEMLAGRVHPGDVVLVKASRALGLEAVVGGLMGAR